MKNLPFIILVSILIYCKRSLAVLSISIHFKLFHSTQSIYNHIYSTTTENMSSLTKSPSFLQNKKKMNWHSVAKEKYINYFSNTMHARVLCRDPRQTTTWCDVILHSSDPVQRLLGLWQGWGTFIFSVLCLSS